MKNIIFGLLLVLLTSFTFNIERVPSIVKDAFDTQFPTAIKVSWHKSIDSLHAPLYEAECYVNGKHTFIIYTILGTAVELEEDINYSELPEGIQEQMLSCDYVSAMSAYNYELDNIYYHVKCRESKHRYKDIYFDQECNITEEISYYYNPSIGYVLITGVFITFVIMLF